MSLTMQRALRRMAHPGTTLQKVTSDITPDDVIDTPRAPRAPTMNPAAMKTGPKPTGALQTDAAVAALRKKATQNTADPFGG